MQALCGIYAKDVHVRLACLNAIKCIPSVSGHSLPQDFNVSTSIWIALHDPQKVCLFLRFLYNFFFWKLELALFAVGRGCKYLALLLSYCY